jgi:hypothetical protein
MALRGQKRPVVAVCYHDPAKEISQMGNADEGEAA